ncbi:Mannan endo-1,4-beta-mannosidase [Armadillidium vulgare]|nr:Mannan endo-1,4-beta-mannosidase [Armadillidium vulgare]
MLKYKFFFLKTSGSTFTYNGQQVYLNGVNIAWNNYGYDFGNGGYDGTLDEWLSEIGNAGGNAVRIWVHVEGYSTPTFDGDGYVTSCDTSGTFYDDVTRFLNTAQANNILVILTLWNGAVSSNQNEMNLFWDDKDASWFVSSVAGHPALAAWEAVNEPEGSVLVESNSKIPWPTEIPLIIMEVSFLKQTPFLAVGITTLIPVLMEQLVALALILTSTKCIPMTGVVRGAPMHHLLYLRVIMASINPFLLESLLHRVAQEHH